MEIPRGKGNKPRGDVGRRTNDQQCPDTNHEGELMSKNHYTTIDDDVRRKTLRSDGRLKAKLFAHKFPVR